MKSGKQRAVRYAMVPATVVIALAAFLGYRRHVMLEVPRLPHFPPPRDLAQAQRGDLEYLRSSMHALDRSFSPEAWRRFDRQIGTLMARAGHLSDAQFELGVAEAIAFADNGHTNADGVARGVTLNSIPVRLDWFKEGLFVVAAAASQSALVGGQVLQEGGRTPEDIVGALRPYFGGNGSHLRSVAPYLMESPAALNAIGLIPSAASVSLAVKAADGRVLQEVVPAEAMPANGPTQTSPLLEGLREHHDVLRDLSPAHALEDGRQWVRALKAGQQISPTLRDPYTFYWHAYLATGQVLLLQINACISEPGKRSLANYLAEVVREARSKRPRYAIVDLRFNEGGNYTETAKFTRDLPAAIPSDGRIFILTSNDTFSAAIVTAARLKYFSRGRALIVGEPVGDRLQFWAEGHARLVLPNSGLKIHYATAYHDWAHGCSLWEILRCNPQNYVYGVAAGTLAPDIHAPWSFQDYVRGHDSALDEVLAKLSRDTRSGEPGDDIRRDGGRAQP